VDTTGAGDTFTGYVLACLARGCSVEESLEVAAKASAITVTRQGAASAIPARAEVEAG
jgi:ribokinase